jgi:CheY-like chemotaxis protein
MMKSAVNILLVEDEAFAAMTLRQILTHMGYTRCHVVATGEDAIAFAEQNPPDLLLMDIRLAGPLNGIEAAQQILASYQNIPIIFMTGYTSEKIMEQIQALNPVGSFVKPLPITELLTAIESLFP